MASGGVCWFYIVSGGFRPSLVLLSTERLNVGLDLMCSFSRKNLLHTSFCTKLQSFLFSTFKNSWRKIVSKDFCTFTGVYIAINMGPCRRSYILIVQKFWTSKMLDKWSPTSKMSNIKLFHYLDGRHIFFTCTRTRLSAIPIKPIFWYLQIFSLVYYDWISSIG